MNSLSLLLMIKCGILLVFVSFYRYKVINQYASVAFLYSTVSNNSIQLFNSLQNCSEVLCNGRYSIGGWNLGSWFLGA